MDNRFVRKSYKDADVKALMSLKEIDRLNYITDAALCRDVVSRWCDNNGYVICGFIGGGIYECFAAGK